MSEAHFGSTVQTETAASCICHITAGYRDSCCIQQRYTGPTDTERYTTPFRKAYEGKRGHKTSSRRRSWVRQSAGTPKSPQRGPSVLTTVLPHNPVHQHTGAAPRQTKRQLPRPTYAEPPLKFSVLRSVDCLTRIVRSCCPKRGVCDRQNGGKPCYGSHAWPGVNQHGRWLYNETAIIES
ncbi:hypothetical protein Bbelb_217760 [Branchiostoma belcheri]|nr:hypothetical protein Bbelb_217760 [Branchiostoma belcheri]